MAPAYQGLFCCGVMIVGAVDVGQTSVAKYMARRRRPPSQGWKTFLRNHADGIASIDLFVVRTISFRLLYGLLIMLHGESYGWERRRIRRLNGSFKRRLHAMAIRDRPTAPRSPWQNGHTERLIGSIRRECLDHVVVLGERHLRGVLRSYMEYYNGQWRALNKDAPVSRSIQVVGRILPTPILGGLHHPYVRI
jgi:hypothetical protein